jgi:hypothetical protein
MVMVCVKELNIIGGTDSNLTIGKQYNVIHVPITIPEDDEMKYNDSPGILVISDTINNLIYGNCQTIEKYPEEAFVELFVWRELQLNKLV